MFILLYYCRFWTIRSYYEALHTTHILIDWKHCKRRALRVMSFSTFDANSDPLFKRMGIMTIKGRLLFNTLIYIFQALNSLSSFNSINYFKVKSYRSGTRASNKINLEIPFTRLTLFSNSIFVKGCKMYNTTDVKLRSVDKLSKFVFNIRHNLTDTYKLCKSLF
jgi:hypothetical protein